MIVFFNILGFLILGMVFGMGAKYFYDGCLMWLSCEHREEDPKDG